MRIRTPRAFVALGLTLFATIAAAWRPDGHHTVGAIADRLISATHAEAQVRTLLGNLSLEQAAVWADCAKGVDPAKNFAYTAAGKYPECALYETADGEAEMIDFVCRNDTSCPRVPGDESCHKQYHYSDGAIQRKQYHLGDVGTRPFDVVAAVSATIHVLQGDPAPAPFDIKDQREALLLLAHYVGDIEQPLHVGAVYLNPKGQVIDPDQGTFDPATGTQGGNEVTTIHVATNRRSETSMPPGTTFRRSFSRATWTPPGWRWRARCRRLAVDLRLVDVVGLRNIYSGPRRGRGTSVRAAAERRVDRSVDQSLRRRDGADQETAADRRRRATRSGTADHLAVRAPASKGQVSEGQRDPVLPRRDLTAWARPRNTGSVCDHPRQASVIDTPRLSGDPRFRS
jgi:hypothetical protein